MRLRREYLAEQMEAARRAIDRLARDAVDLAVASHALEVLRLEERLLAEIEPMLGQ
ncbi:MAG: hypothetical protein U1D55_04485 [Phycisphaerae bacterium]